MIVIHEGYEGLARINPDNLMIESVRDLIQQLPRLPVSEMDLLVEITLSLSKVGSQLPGFQSKCQILKDWLAELVSDFVFRVSCGKCRFSQTFLRQIEKTDKVHKRINL